MLKKKKHMSKIGTVVVFQGSRDPSLLRTTSINNSEAYGRGRELRALEPPLRSWHSMGMTTYCGPGESFEKSLRSGGFSRACFIYETT